MAAIDPGVVEFLDKQGWPIERFMNQPRSWRITMINLVRTLIHVRSIRRRLKSK